MPRVKANKYIYKQKDLAPTIKSWMILRNKRQQEMAEALDMTQPNFSIKLRNGTLTYIEMVKAVEELQLEDEQILQLMRC